MNTFIGADQAAFEPPFRPNQMTKPSRPVLIRKLAAVALALEGMGVGKYRVSPFDRLEARDRNLRSEKGLNLARRVILASPLDATIAIVRFALVSGLPPRMSAKRNLRLFLCPFRIRTVGLQINQKEFGHAHN
jgi:hypothetical protein